MNHGLVHRYFGSKDALVRAALRARATDSVDQFSGAGSAADLVARLRSAAADPEAGWRLLAHCLLDGYGEELDRDGAFPGIARFIDVWSDAQGAGLIRGDIPPVDVARLMLATMLGWLQFHEYIAASTHLDQGDSLDEITVALMTLLAPRPSRSTAGEP